VTEAVTALENTTFSSEELAAIDRVLEESRG
jgi:hypothetical protein